MSVKHHWFSHKGSLDVSDSASYIAGMAVAIDTDGEVMDADSAVLITIAGIARNDATVDIANGSAAVYYGQAELTIYASDPTDLDTCPFDSTKTFAGGDYLFVDTDKLITNVDPVDGQVAFGMVYKVEGTVAEQEIRFFLRV